MFKQKKISMKKICPGCGLQFPVAVKTCSNCKHSFYLSKKDVLPKATATAVSSSNEESKDITTETANVTLSDGRRRTGRVRREKPNYYDASAFIRETRKRTEKPKNNFEGRQGGVQLTQSKRGGTSQKQNYKTNDIQDPDDKIYNDIMRNEKAQMCSLILSELNEKLMLTSWRP